MTTQYESIILKQDNGSDLEFRGRLFSEYSWFDEESKQLTRQKLYMTDTQEQIYYIVRSAGKEKTRHAYRFTVQDETCKIDNGKTEVTLPLAMLMHVVRELCGMSAAEAMSDEAETCEKMSGTA